MYSLTPISIGSDGSAITAVAETYSYRILRNQKVSVKICGAFVVLLAAYHINENFFIIAALQKFSDF